MTSANSRLTGLTRSRKADQMPALQSCDAPEADTLTDAEIDGSEFGVTEICVVSADHEPNNGADYFPGKDRPTMKRLFLSDKDAPVELMREVDKICRRLTLSRQRDRQAVLRQLRLQTQFRGCYVAY